MTYLPKAVLLLSLTATLTACSGVASHRNPELSSISLDETTVPESVILNIPMPEAKPGQSLVRAEAASLWQKGSTGFFGDQRAAQVGDIMTVHIDIDDEASLENGTSRKRSSNNRAGAPTLFGYETKLGKILPGLNQADVPTGRIVDLSGSSESSGEGSIERNEQISLKVAAMIMRVLPNGNFVIAGRQEVRVNNELRELRVAGLVRPVDIEMNNSITYDKIAEARISYGGKGTISRMQQPRYGEDALDVILPF